MLTLRFDMRIPAGPVTDHYSTTLDMCEWAETVGVPLVVLSEQHGTSDGHLSTPLMFASAIAARTQQMAILLAAVPLPLWDPVRLAEEIGVLDLISRSKVSYVFGIGHREEECAHFGVDFAARGALADDYLAALTALVRGEPADFRDCGSTSHRAAHAPTGPGMMIAGGSKAAVRRAAAQDLGFISQVDRSELKTYYEAHSLLDHML